MSKSPVRSAQNPAFVFPEGFTLPEQTVIRGRGRRANRQVMVDCPGSGARDGEYTTDGERPCTYSRIPAAICPACSTWKQLRKDGPLAKHKSAAWRIRWNMP